jgi:hypothetical protein
MNKFKKAFLNSSVFNALTIIKKTPNLYLYTIILDFVFLTIFIFLGKYLASFIPADAQQLMDIFKTQLNLLLLYLYYLYLFNDQDDNLEFNKGDTRENQIYFQIPG